ncbi:MAG: glycerol-3-phosphate 1-O-acyltransferase PlsY [Legionellaceae bacterium]|nr:glycerol-3-phosphate 1-O-acyltransferase PlsY [Legionellaceae bacterium]
MFAILLFFIAIGLAYLAGSLCSAVIVCNLCKLPDPRLEGSKNPGATNVLRISGKKYAVIVLLGDMLKGFIPVLIAKFFGAGPTFLGYMCLAAVLGHIYPKFFDFKGGKGVATALGALFGLYWVLGVIACVIWLLVAVVTRYSSLASIVTWSIIPILTPFYPESSGAFLPILVMSFFVLYQHRDNFIRLQKKEESKIGF